MSQMEGGALIPPQVVAVEQGHQEMLAQSHIKVDSRYFAIDPNLDFESSTILCEDRVYVSDQTPNPNQPITFTIQPQFNVFRSLSESRFVFTVQVVLNSGVIPQALGFVPKPYWSQLFVRDFTCNINNVACNDQHSRTASYAGFIKILLTQGNLKSASVDTSTYASTTTPPLPLSNYIVVNSLACDDTRTLQEGIINLDTLSGVDWIGSYNNVVMNSVVGSLNAFGFKSLYLYNSQGPLVLGAINNKNLVSIELTYRPQDGLFLQPKLLPPGVNLNYIFSANTLGTWANGYAPGVLSTSEGGDVVSGTSINPDLYATYTILKAQYYERQYTPTQTALRAYQSLIMRQPLYYSCMTSNTLLYPVTPTAQSVQLTNVFSGRLPNVVVVALLNQAPVFDIWSGGSGNPGTGNSYLFKTYSPLPTIMDTINSNTTVAPADCIQSIQLTVNGRTYPHLWSSNMQPYSTADISQWYEQYRQCALVSKLNGRDDGAANLNYDVKYKYDNPILTKAEFQSQCTFCCFNIRRSGTIMNDSGDKEVGGIDMLVNINGTAHPSAQLLVCGINTDSLMTITDGGSTTSFVF
jgi:hypothetical protein